MNGDQMTPEERLIAEQAVLHFQELGKACDAAADGTELSVWEKRALQQGRELIRRTIGVALHGQADAVKKKRRRPARAAE
jgi:hypothetical protein